MSPIHVVILAAGQGTRMKSALPKVLHPVAGKPMLGHVLDTAQALGAGACHVVLGHGSEQVLQWFDRAYASEVRVHWALQAQQLGTAHAVLQAMPPIPDDALVVVLYGDVPLVSEETVRALADAAGTGLALVTVTLAAPKGYGRILRDAQGRVRGIVEENDADVAQKRITEVNTGLLAAPAAALKRWLAAVGNDNAKGEYYLTDIVAMAVADGVPVHTVDAISAEEVEGVNDRAQLARAERRFQQRQAQALLRDGLGLADPARFDLRGSLRYGRDVTLDVGVVLEGDIVLEDGVQIGPYAVLRNVTLGAGTQVLAHSVLDGVIAGRDCRIGPFARIRPETELADDVHIGNFVEIKKGRLGRATKAGHLAYIGDAIVGADVNISAGVITCNYDGANKHVTVIGDGAFIGSDSQLVAPVEIGANAFIAAGSTIAKNAPPEQLTINRPREQRSLAGWKRPQKKPK